MHFGQNQPNSVRDNNMARNFLKIGWQSSEPLILSRAVTNPFTPELKKYIIPTFKKENE